MVNPVKEENPGISRRRVPRRSFFSPVGVLVGGQYAVERAYQLGEGGMMIDFSRRELQEGQHLAVSFPLPGGLIVIVRGIVRAIIPSKGGHPKRYGLEFVSLAFNYKRAIRNFVAAATREEA